MQPIVLANICRQNHNLGGKLTESTLTDFTLKDKAVRYHNFELGELFLHIQEIL